MKCRFKEISLFPIACVFLLVVGVLHAVEWDSVPLSQTSFVGGEAVFQAVGRAAERFTYQWQHNGINIAGAVEKSLILRDLKISQAGDYQVSLKLESGQTLVSPSARLTLVKPPPPRWVVHPQGITLPEGETQPVQLEAKAYSPVPLSYEWLLGNQPVMGAISNRLTVSVPLETSFQTYRLLASNAGGTITSRVAHIVRKVSNPATVIFANLWPGGPNAPVFLNDGTSKVEDTNFVAQLYAGPELHLFMPVGAPSHFLERADAGYWDSTQPLRQLEWLSAGARALGRVHVWDLRNGLTFEEAEIRGGLLGASEWIFLDTGAEVVPGSIATPPQPLRELRTITLQYYEAKAPLPSPEIEINGANLRVSAGEQLLLEVVEFRSSVPARSIQWRFNGTNLPGETNFLFRIPKAQLEHSGRYDVVINNGVVETISNSRLVLVDEGPLPVLLIEREGAETPPQWTLSVSAEASQITPLIFQWYLGDAPISGETNRFFRKTGTLISSGECWVAVSNVVGSVTNLVTKLALPPPSPFIRISSSGYSYPGTNFTLTAEYEQRLTTNVVGVPVLSWFQNDVLLSSGPLQSKLIFTPFENQHLGDYRVVLSNALGSITSAVFRVQEDSRLRPVFLEHPTDQKQTAGTVTWLMSVVRTVDGAPIEWQWRFNGVPIVGARETTWFLWLNSTNQSGDYDVIASSFGGSTTSHVARITVLPPSPPTIVEQPGSLVVTRGINHAFEVRAQPDNVVQSFQWRFNGTDIPGATNQVLRLHPVQSSHAGFYQVRVENEGGSVESAPARLVVHEAVLPKILFHPKSVRIHAGDSFVLGISVLGSQPFSFQWRQNGRDIPGATNQSYGHHYALSSDAGVYSVVFSNSAGSVESQEATVEISGAVTNNLQTDFNGDGHNDLVFQHSNGSIGIWYLKSEALVGTGVISHRLPGDPGQWRVIGAASFKQDGHPDLLLANVSNHTYAVWNLNETNLIGGSYLETSASIWNKYSSIVSASDFNRDGHPELVYAREGHASGVTYLDRLTRQRDDLLPFFSSLPGHFPLVGCGDLDGDGYSDLVGQSIDGMIVVTFLRETQFLRSEAIAVADPGWHLGAIVDLDGDARSDLVFQHEDGSLAVWFVDGVKLKRATFLDPRYPGEGWSLVAPR